MIENKYNQKSVLGKFWKLPEVNERSILSYSQANQISPLLSKLLLIRKINNQDVSNFLDPIFADNIPNPFLLLDMEKSVERTIKAIKNNQKIAIVADYDVDGSTSASILYKYLIHFTKNIFISIPDRLNEGYGPNLRIMNELLDKKTNLIFTLDCGTTSFDIIDNEKYRDIDIIVIDHHLSENKLPNVFSIINPNRSDEKNPFTDLAAVGVTFLFLMALRKQMRNESYFINFQQPNLLSMLDLVALGTVCDVVDLTKYNRIFVKKGLELIKKRKNVVITKILDNSNLNSAPNSSDLGFMIGPQLNAASRIDDSSLPSKLLISKNIDEIEKISKKLL